MLETTLEVLPAPLAILGVSGALIGLRVSISDRPRSGAVGKAATFDSATTLDKDEQS